MSSEPQASDSGADVEDDSDEEAPGFAPSAPTDGREPGEWASRFQERRALFQIGLEAFYVLGLLTLVPVAMIIVELRLAPLTNLFSAEQWDKLTPFLHAYLGGLFGGGLFATKWLYHTVAKATWNADRFLWRIFTPLLSGGVAVTIILLCAGRVIPLFGSDLVRTSAGALGVSILVGYFSDKTFSRLERLAEQHLGGKRSKGDE